MARFIGGVLAVLVLGGLGGLVVVETGAFDVRASTPHASIVAWAAHTTMIHAARRGSLLMRAPAGFTAAQTLAGARAYHDDCSLCHGGPGEARADWVQGMNPSPPFLVDASRHWTRAQLYWIVKNGVKMTGMPSWGATRSDADIWNIVAFIEAMPYVSPDDYRRMRSAAAGTGPQAGD